jgi:hypothetical protein
MLYVYLPSYNTHHPVVATIMLQLPSFIDLKEKLTCLYTSYSYCLLSMNLL